MRNGVHLVSYSYVYECTCLKFHVSYFMSSCLCHNHHHTMFLSVI